MSMDRTTKRARALLARNVKAARERAGTTIEELARACGIPETALRAIERGQHDVPIDTLASLAAHLRMTLAQLFEP